VVIPARARGLALQTALRTPRRLPPTLGRATGDEGVDDLLLGRGDPLALPGAVAREAEEVGDFPPRPVGPGWRSPAWGPPTTGGIAALRHGTGPVVRPPQPSAWAMDLGHVLPGDRQRPGGRSAAPVAEAERHGP
jgi:hypothetical protein